MSKDPVCGMEVDERDAAGKSRYQGHTYFFCSTDCKEQFDRVPERYAARADQQREPSPTR
jgi:Cu+-exporting ATPase